MATIFKAWRELSNGSIFFDTIAAGIMLALVSAGLRMPPTLFWYIIAMLVAVSEGIFFFHAYKERLEGQKYTLKEVAINKVGAFIIGVPATVFLIMVVLMLQEIIKVPRVQMAKVLVTTFAVIWGIAVLAILVALYLILNQAAVNSGIKEKKRRKRDA